MFEMQEEFSGAHFIFLLHQNHQASLQNLFLCFSEQDSLVDEARYLPKLLYLYYYCLLNIITVVSSPRTVSSTSVTRMAYMYIR
jgi:hypothetical protein